MFLNYMLLVIAEYSLWTEACHLNPHVTRPRAVLGPSVGWWVVGPVGMAVVTVRCRHGPARLHPPGSSVAERQQAAQHRGRAL